MIEFIKGQIEESIMAKQNILSSAELLESIAIISDSIVNLYKNNKKVILCGNGGSAADAQHIAAELVSKFRIERRGLPAIAITTNSSIISAIGNDYEFNRVFQRQVEAVGSNGDALIGITTSGNSKNIINAFIEARKIGIQTIGFLGGDGGEIKKYCDMAIIVPSSDTPRIQESHIMIGHIICDIVERKLFGAFDE